MSDGKSIRNSGGHQERRTERSSSARNTSTRKIIFVPGKKIKEQQNGEMVDIPPQGGLLPCHTEAGNFPDG